ncbi:TPA: hypothetical protein N0F65_011812, partial [Lagenidium giganteum]
KICARESTHPHGPDVAGAFVVVLSGIARQSRASSLPAVPPTPAPSSPAPPHPPAPRPMTSKVLYFDRLPSDFTEEKLRQLLTPLGELNKVVILRKRNALYAGYNPTTLETIKSNTIQALAEVASLDVAAAMMAKIEQQPLTVADRQLAVSYSKNQELRDRNLAPKPRAVGDDAKANRILLVTVQNPTYPITTDLIFEIFSTYGTVQKVVIFVKPIGLQCLVQFETIEHAVEAKGALMGLSIFPDCCGLVINFSNLPQDLIVKENGLRTKDFTNPDLPVVESDVPVNPCAELSNAGILGYPAGPSGAMPAPLVASGREVVSPVLLVCNLRESVTCDNLFNLFSCYGNVARIKKLNGKPDHALIQFSSPLSSQSALVHLRGFTLMGRSLEISYSKHSYISIRPGTGAAAEGEPTWMREYGHGLNRFTGKYANATKHIYSPTKILHLSNFDEDTTQEELKIHLSTFQGSEHAKVKVFKSPSGHLQGLAEFPSVDSSTNVLAQAHNTMLKGKRLKIAFSKHSFH